MQQGILRKSHSAKMRKIRIELTYLFQETHLEDIAVLP